MKRLRGVGVDLVHASNSECRLCSVLVACNPSSIQRNHVQNDHATISQLCLASQSPVARWIFAVCLGEEQENGGLTGLSIRLGVWPVTWER